MTKTKDSMSSSSSAPKRAAIECFRRHFDADPAHIALAPGRVNLIGEHTDYNDGFVLPVAINFHTCVAASPRPDRKISVVAHDENSQQVEFEIDASPEFDTKAPWSNYVRGVVAELLHAGFRLHGANLAISGNVPLGAGLSSSAALEISVIAALTHLSQEPITASEAARIGQAAENNFVGCQCGIMDQMISAAGQTGKAMLLDCRDLSIANAILPDQLAIVVINSNLQRALVDGEYNARREQCETAAAHFNVSALRDITLEELMDQQQALDKVVFRRARHVVTENKRTTDMNNALSASDLPAIARLMADSHASMRDDFEITTPEIDGLVEIVSEVIGNSGGVRMTGGGFGGCVVALTPKTRVTEVISAVEKNYPQIANREAEVFVCEATQGAFANTIEQPGGSTVL